MPTFRFTRTEANTNNRLNKCSQHGEQTENRPSVLKTCDDLDPPLEQTTSNLHVCLFFYSKSAQGDVTKMCRNFPLTSRWQEALRSLCGWLGRINDPRWGRGWWGRKGRQIFCLFYVKGRVVIFLGAAAHPLSGESFLPLRLFLFWAGHFSLVSFRGLAKVRKGVKSCWKCTGKVTWKCFLNSIPKLKLM